jgi:hypothetical protein
MSLLAPPFPPQFSSDERFEEYRTAECTDFAKGTTRTVYSTRDNRYVLKVANTDSDTVSNWIEVTAFLYFKSDQEKLASIITWSVSGKFLVMERLDMTPSSIASFEYPAWITDTKHSNIGKAVDGKLKFCDYALVRDADFGYRSEFE